MKGHRPRAAADFLIDAVAITMFWLKPRCCEPVPI
jgi:hypothetical protein